MLAVIWKKLDQVERVANQRSSRSAPITTHLKELKELAEKERKNFPTS